MPTPTPADPAAPNRLRETLQTERPQERLERLGASALSDTELLAMLLRSGTRGHDVLTLAANLLNTAGSLSNLLAWQKSDFKKLKGIGRVKALQLLTVMELARRILTQENGNSPNLSTPEAAYRYLQPIALHHKVEKVWLLALNTRHRLIKCREITIGTSTQSLFHPREILRAAIAESATTIICAHNHPTGDPTPSPADITATRQLTAAAQTVGIPLLDHIIVGTPSNDPARLGFFSFRRSGLIPSE